MIVENNNNEMIAFAFANQLLIVTQSLPVAFFVQPPNALASQMSN